MNRDELFETIDRLDDQAFAADSTSTSLAVDVWGRAVDILCEYLVAWPDDLRGIYYLGYVYYMIWARTGEVDLWAKSLHFLSKCENYTPVAKFWICCLYFESGRDCLDGIQFSSSERESLKVIHQDWRLAKVAEMKLASAIRKDHGDFYKLAAEMVQAYAESESPWSLLPITIGNTLENLLSVGFPRTPAVNAVLDAVKSSSIVSDSLTEMRKRFPLIAKVWQSDDSASMQNTGGGQSVTSPRPNDSPPSCPNG